MFYFRTRLVRESMIRRLSSGWSIFFRPSRANVRFCSGKPPGDADNEWWGDNAQPGSLFDDVDEEDDDHSNKSDKPIVRRPVSEFKAAPVRRVPVVEGTPRISLSEALYLAKEAGVFTTREVQTHLIKSPSFSTTDSPFLLENFFVSENEASTDGYSADLKSGSASLVVPWTTEAEASNNAPSESEPRDVVPESIHLALSALSKNVPVFIARNREWKIRSEAKGTRKRATAHVLIEKGTGIVKVNGEEDFFKRFPLLSNRFDVLYPMEACGASGLFDVYIAVKGGGISGQAGAARLALGRALVNACADCEADLKHSLVLLEDTRQRTSKFAGKKGAYARHNWTLR